MIWAGHKKGNMELIFSSWDIFTIKLMLMAQSASPSFAMIGFEMRWEKKGNKRGAGAGGRGSKMSQAY